MATTDGRRFCPREAEEDLTAEDLAELRWASEQLREDPYRFLRGEEREQ